MLVEVVKVVVVGVLGVDLTSVARAKDSGK